VEGFETKAGTSALVWAKALPFAQTAMHVPMAKAAIRRALHTPVARMNSANKDMILLLPRRAIADARKASRTAPCMTSNVTQCFAVYNVPAITTMPGHTQPVVSVCETRLSR
jgi:hypothetical protein